MIPVAPAITVLISAYLVRVQTMWRQAPITTAIVIAAEFTSRRRLQVFVLPPRPLKLDGAVERADRTRIESSTESRPARGK